mmetsp:Transcript_22231/g.63780  ORF Transcript_22231/g.63780 Transcript_22231/m.63780 type:complete len:201 (+) Transcript_22231:100-702(+)
MFWTLHRSLTLRDIRVSSTEYSCKIIVVTRFSIYIQYYIREFEMFMTNMSVAPIFCKASIFSETSFFKTKDDTDLTVPHSKVVTVGDRFPGVTLIASFNSSFATLNTIIAYFVAVMYPSIRFFNKSTMSWWGVLGLEIKIASVVKISWTTSRPAAFIVVPVSTRSTTASARPKPQAASTDPETKLTSVFVPALSSYSLKN